MLAHSYTHSPVDLKRHGPAKLVSLRSRWSKKTAAKVKVIKSSAPLDEGSDEASNAPSFVGLAG